MENIKIESFKSVDFMRDTRKKLNAQYLENPKKFLTDLKAEMTKFKSLKKMPSNK